MRTYPAFLLVALLSACPDCPGPNGGGDDGGGVSSSSSSGGAASSSSSGSSGASSAGDGGVDGGDAGPVCGPETPGYGEPCSADGSEPFCGAMVCGRSGELECSDPGPNACGECGQLDTTAGIVGRDCGSCGLVGCADGGLATECQGEHPPNDCGGCEDFPLGRGPPDAGCSTCETGTWRCRVSLNDLSCWGGRAASNSCGTCERCIKYHADMSDLSQGAFILSGTRAIIEDVGGDTAMGTSATQPHILTFDPLLTGPGGLVMEGGIVYLSPSESHQDLDAFALYEFFSAYGFGEPGDPVRQYHIHFPAELVDMNYVIIFDGFIGQVVSRGRLVAGPPP